MMSSVNETCTDKKCTLSKEQDPFERSVDSLKPSAKIPFWSEKQRFSTTNLIDDQRSSVKFWSEDPNILLKSEYMLEFFPTENMTYEQKLNAITRLIIVMTVVGFVVSQNIRLLVVSVITLTAIYLYYVYQKKEMLKKEGKKVKFENFDTSPSEPSGPPGLSSLSSLSGPVTAALNKTGSNIDPSQVFEPPSAQNPFSNVLMSDYDYNPNRKPAAPSFNENINHDILGQAKQLVKNANPDQPDIADKLFKDLGDQLYFEHSLRPFNSNPSTTIPNDQGAFADFCFGGFISAKEGNSFALARNLARHQNV